MADFQRVSFLSLIYFLGRGIARLLQQGFNLLPILLAVLAGGELVRQSILILAPVLLILYTIASWWYFRYRIEGNTLHVRDGIFTRTHMTLEYERVQQADVRQPWYFRPLGLAVLGVESAGTDGKEVELAGLELNEAMNLKDAMLAGSRFRDDAVTDANRAGEGVPVIHLPLSEVARYGLMSNPVLLGIPVLIYIFAQLELLEDWLIPRLEVFIELLVQGQSLDSPWLVWLPVALASILLVVLLSMLIAIIRFYGFQLSVSGQRYQSRAGLFSVVSRGFQQVRLQRVIWRRGLMGRMLRRWSLRLNQSGRPDDQYQLKAFFVPVLDESRREKMQELLRLTREVKWQRSHPGSMIAPTSMMVALAVVFVLLVTEFNFLWAAHGLWLSLILFLPLQLGLWLRRGVYLDDDWLAVRQGLFRERQHWVPAFKMQTLRLRQGPCMRLFGMSSLDVFSAAGREVISWLPESQLRQWQCSLIKKSTDYTGRWM